MKLARTVGAAMIIALASLAVLAADQPTVGRGGSRPLSLAELKTQFTQLYRSEYETFWAAFRHHEEKAGFCDDAVATADFLDLIRFVRGNAEVGEAFSEFTEKLAAENPRCLLEATTRLSKEAVGLLAEDLSHPLFRTEQELSQHLAPFRSDARYRDFLSLYRGPAR